MCDDVLQEAVALTVSQQIWRSDQHARRRDTALILGHKDVGAGMRQGFRPDSLGALKRLGAGADLRVSEKREELSQVRLFGGSDRHAAILLSIKYVINS